MTQQSSPSAQPVSDTISDGFGSTWSNRCPRCGENSMSVVRPGKVQCDSEKCYQMDMMEEEQFKKDVEYIMAVPEEGKRERIRKGLYELLIGIVDSEKDRQFVLSYLDGVLDSLLPEKVDHQAVSEKQMEKLIKDLRDFEWRGKNLGMIIEDLRYRLFQKEKECRGLQKENDLANIKIGMLKAEYHQKEEECRRLAAELKIAKRPLRNHFHIVRGEYMEGCDMCEAMKDIEALPQSKP